MGSDRRPAGPPVAVLVSERLADAGAGIDLTDLRDRLVASVPGSRVTVIADPASPGEVGRAAVACGAERLVLGTSRPGQATGAAQTEARLAGIDPLGVETVDLAAHAALLCDRRLATDRALVLLAGAVAKARAFAGSGPEHVQPQVSVAMSRRALLRFSPSGYRGVPSVLPERCAAEHGCRLCVEACPAGAVGSRGDRVALDKARCASCGLCLAACPSEAIVYPGWSDAEIDAQVSSLLDRTIGELSPRGILFVCRATAASMETAAARGLGYPSTWLPVIVPCVGMLSAASLLRPLVAGADGVGVVPCGATCPFFQELVVLDRVAFCAEALVAMGAEPGLVRLCAWRDDRAPEWALTESAFRAGDGAAVDPSRRAADTVLSLAHRYGAAADLRVAGDRSPLATLAFDDDSCTSCASCAGSCPTGALSARRDDGATRFEFDAALCGGCGLCVARCPEVTRGALRLWRGIDLAALGSGRTTVRRDPTAGCKACGDPIAPAAMLRRVAALLGDDYAPLAATVSRYCPSCRVLASGDEVRA